MTTFTGDLSRVTGSSITVSMEEFQQQVLPSSFPKTIVWGYKVGNRPHLYPGVTIEAQRGISTIVTYVNNLPNPPVLQKYLTVDQSIHFADPLGQMGSFAPYAGPPPLVTHLHGAEVPSEFDGQPDAWFTPNGLRGNGYRSLNRTATNAAIYKYFNRQEATTLWFHDHTLGMVRLNLFAGLAAFYLLRDPNSFDTGASTPGGLPAGAYEHEILIQDRQFDTNGQWLFPDGSPAGLNGPPTNPDVHPFWNPEFIGDVNVVNGKSWPFLEVEPRRYRFRFLNGSNARFYELRLLNKPTRNPGPAFWVIGTDGGLLDFPVKLNDPSVNNGPKLLIAPAERSDVIIDFAGFAGQTLTLLNSAKVPFPNGLSPDPQTFGEVMQFRVVKPPQGDTSYNPASGGPLRTLMVRLANPVAGTLASGVTPDVKRQMVLVEVEGAGGPLEVLLNNTKWSGRRESDGTPIPGSELLGLEWLTELPRVGSTEEWEIVNTTADAHPIHLHLVQFQIVNRQAFNGTQYRNLYDSQFPGSAFIPGYGPPNVYFTPNGAGAMGGNPDVGPFLQGAPIPPQPEEAGWKDTVKMLPGQVTRIVARWAPQGTAVGAVSPGQNLYDFDPTGATKISVDARGKPATAPGYTWHCHILDHEDNEMMRPYIPVS